MLARSLIAGRRSFIEYRASTARAYSEHIAHIMLSDESKYRIFKALEANPAASQRELARELGISLGKVNYCVNALIDKGMIKAGNFRQSNNKVAYLYQLTPKGIDHKTKVTARFLKRKLEEYETLQTEIEELRREASGL